MRLVINRKTRTTIDEKAGGHFEHKVSPSFLVGTFTMNYNYLSSRFQFQNYNINKESYFVNKPDYDVIGSRLEDV